MIKKLILLVAIVLFTGYNLLCDEERKTTGLCRTNVEALANGEVEGSGTASVLRNIMCMPLSVSLEMSND